MKVTALVTAYNYGRFVCEAVDSVLGQTYSGEVECIVVDDGSVDDTAAVLALYADRVQYVRQENQGQAAAFNTGYERSTGDVICFLDADDLWDPSKVARVVDEFRARPEVGLVHHGLRLVDGRGKPVAEFRRGGERADGDVRRTMRKKVLRWMFSPTSGLCLRRSVAGTLFPLQDALRTSADELVAPVAALLAPVRYVPDELGSYRIHGANLWATGAMAGQVPADDRKRAASYIAVLEAKVRQANLACERAGIRERLSPWMKWDYLEAMGQVAPRSPLAYLTRGLRATFSSNGLSWPDRISVAAALTRKAFRHGGFRRVKGATA